MISSMNEPEPPRCAGRDRDPRTPKLIASAGACDCHVHILGPLNRYPYVPDRAYTPPEATLGAYRYMLATLGVMRAVIVQPSVYGTDNRATLAAVEASDGALRGVAVVEATVNDRTLADLHAAGNRGLRINPAFKAAADLADCPALAARTKDLGWHLQIFIDLSTLDTEALAMLERLPVPVVFDHMGYIPVEKGLRNSGFQWLLAQLASGRGWVKLSGSYYLGRNPGPAYADVAPFARALIEANSERCLWATNWPHPMTPKPMANDGDLLDLLADWAPDPALQRRILVDNPAALYGFPAL